jgi:hypothetical protein
MQAAQECVLSRGPWPAQGILEAVEIMWDDGSDSPYAAVHLTPESFGVLPAEPPPGPRMATSACGLNGFSKNWENHYAALSLYFAYYNS